MRLLMWGRNTCAKMFGVNKHYVRRVFRGDVAASLAQLEWLAAGLGCEFSVTLVSEPVRA